MFLAIKNIKIQCGIEGKLMRKENVVDAVRCSEQNRRSQDFRYDC